MIEKLSCDFTSTELMEYIGIVEALYTSSPAETDLPHVSNGRSRELTEEEKERLRNRPLNFATCMEVFTERYNAKAIPLKYTDYIKNEEIQKLVEYLELDAEKFWLLILFVYDYSVNLFYQGLTVEKSPIEKLQKFVDMANFLDNATLKLKANKVELEISDAETLQFMADAIVDYSRRVASIEKLRQLNNSSKKSEAALAINESPFIAYFANMFLRFFCTQPQIVGKRKKGAKRSTKETDLVCKLIYYTKLSTKKCWLVNENETLKSYLKQYTNYIYPDYESSVYPKLTYY